MRALLFDIPAISEVMEKNNPKWKNNTCVIAFLYNNRVSGTFLSFPEGTSGKKRIFVLVAADVEGIWFPIWPAGRRWWAAEAQGAEQGSC